MLKVAGKPIIEHNMEHVYKHVDEIIIIVRHLKEQFIEYFGLDYKGTPVRYFEQGPKNGTAAALFGLFITDDAMVLYGDSIFEKRDISLLAKHKKYGCLVQRVEHPERYGIFIAQVDGTAMKVIEKPEEDYGNLANVGAYKFSPDIFKYLKNVEQSERGEYELTDAINTYCEKHRFDLIDMKGSFVDV
jgi:dTDP-glucose pyrophosphorylase